MPSFTHSKLVLNLSEFLSSAEHTCYFEECGKPNSCWSPVSSIVFLRSFFPGASAPHRDKNISTFQNAVGVTESAADGCLATTNASGAQPPERFGKKEKAARLAFSMRF